MNYLKYSNLCAGISILFRCELALKISAHCFVDTVAPNSYPATGWMG
jgi:hypothetical protein